MLDPLKSPHELLFRQGNKTTKQFCMGMHFLEKYCRIISNVCIDNGNLCYPRWPRNQFNVFIDMLHELYPGLSAVA